MRFRLPERYIFLSNVSKTKEKEEKKKILFYLRMPYVENAWICCTDNFNIGANILPVEHYILATPSNNFLIKSTYLEEI